MSTDFTSVWDDAGESAEQAEAHRAMATAKEASKGTQQFLFLATDEADFGHRVALAEDSIFKAATAAGVSPEALVAEHKREFGLLMEAKRSVVAADDTGSHTACPNHEGQWFNKSTGDCSCGSNHHRWASPNNPGGYGKKSASLGKTCPTCSGARAVPAQGHESFGEVSNGQVRCPSCHGHGVVAQDPDQSELTSHERYGDVGDGLGDPGDAQDRWYEGDYNASLKHIASIKTALEEGVDPLEWLEQEGAGEGQAEKPSEAGIEAVGSLSKEAFDWLKKNPPAAPQAPEADPLEGRATCGCGSRMTAPMRDGSDKHKCFNCDSVFAPKTGSVSRPF